MMLKSLEDHQYDRALRWLSNNPDAKFRHMPGHIREKFEAQKDHIARGLKEVQDENTRG